MSPARDRVAVLDIPVVYEQTKGFLAIIDGEQLVPFPIRQVLVQYGMERDGIRGEHARRRTQEFIVCVHGRAEVTTHGRHGTRTNVLDRPDRGLYVPPLSWVTLRCIALDCVCLVAMSEHYDETDYIRDFDQFQSLVAGADSPGQQH